ncbi:MAG: translation initiation factor IF-2, partial [Deltaproteobacteria bacterium]|nr:translation initiation factor IF-2 [Deltaproteobacteria bacterium]
LAKELNIESKELVDKLISGGMAVKNYMSTLDDSDVKKAKEILKGNVSEVIEEKRIKRNVIRRRKVVQVEESEVSAEALGESPEEEKVAVQKDESVSTEVDKVEEAAGVREKEQEIKEIPLSETEVEEPLELAEDVKTSGKQEVLQTEEISEEESDQVVSDAADLSEAEEAREKERPAGKKGKKKLKDRPAKIIRLPEQGPLKDVLAKDKDKKEAVKEPVEVKEKKTAKLEDFSVEPDISDEEIKKSKKKKDRKKGDKAGKEVDSGVRIKHRKLEVFERADLYEDRRPRLKDRKSGKKSKEAVKRLRQTEITTPKASKRRLKVPENVTVSDLAKAMGVKAAELIKLLIRLGVMANMNMKIDFETACLAADEFGYELELDQFEMEVKLDEVINKPEDLKPRPPVVTIMGHVDHGKTSLLDYIRSSNIIGGESGGITQHIGAYYVEREGGDIVFLDTPGHEAFTAMRARGARVTDIIILVVAADDGVMPQTKEAVNHARAANIPIIVAINKIDKPEANPDKVTRELAELDLTPEEWGGQTIFGKISAKTGEGVDELMELILLQAEMLELRSNPDRPARGTIIEAQLDKSRGSVATVLIKEGTLRPSDHFICGESYGRVRAMLNNRGKKLKEATPSVPVEIYGMTGVPKAGDEFYVVPDEKTARQIVAHRQAKLKEKERSKSDIVNLDDLYEKIREGAIKELNIIIKADVQGSLEALSESLKKLATEAVKIRVIHSSTGAITESDVMLASASGAIIIGFRVRTNARVVQIAERESIDIRYYDVIYDLIEDIKKAMAGLLEPIYKENIIGHVDIKQIFSVPKIGKIAGCYVTDGQVERNSMIRLLRDDVVIFNGKISSLRRLQNDVKEVQAGYECGIGLESFQDIKPGDVLEVYKVEEIKAEL